MTYSINITDGSWPPTGAKVSVATFHNADGQALAANSFGLLTGGVDQLFNGTTFDRQRGNIDTGALATLTAAGAQTTTIANQTNYNSRGLALVINITAVAGTPTLTVTLQGVDSASGAVYTLLASAAISTVSTVVMTVYPGLVAANNTVANTILPRTWNVKYVIAGTTPSFTGTIGASVIN